jgi:hypothetical protein
MRPFAALFAVAAVLAGGCSALRAYDKSAPLAPGTVLFSWTLTDDTAKIALIITDKSVVKPDASALWLGVGIGDPQRFVRPARRLAAAAVP